ncbi:unnamed protein product [Euphydryas editha]|uniref:Uncharacterized protein n=1 Tax=Euphydryas editha TaxID=104508 RepID=A0AAU9UAD7_EUPED|nr:unnamed protein product [Euphydryas editha]
MDKRYDKSPTKASAYAFWTLQDVLYKNFSEKYLHKPNLNDKPDNNISENAYHKENKDYSGDTNESSNESDHVIAREINEINNGDTEDNEEVRKNVWSDIDDELYIANLIKFRTTNEVNRVKRDNYPSVSDYSDEVVNSVKLDKNEMWDLEPTDITECDCLGPPPEFLLPPPPRPPFLQADYYCGDDPIPDLETCDTEPVSTYHYLVCNNLNRKYRQIHETHLTAIVICKCYY